MDKQLVIFELADEHFGVDIASVESIIKMQAITRVPHAPQFVEEVTQSAWKSSAGYRSAIAIWTVFARNDKDQPHYRGIHQRYQFGHGRRWCLRSAYRE